MYQFDPITRPASFYGLTTPYELTRRYGLPLYVYNERILRERCRELKSFVTYPNFSVNYSVKANSNLPLLRIIREEGLVVDAMSLGEIVVEKAAGFTSDQIFYVSNNISAADMQAVIDQGILISADSLTQLELFGCLCPGGRVCARINTGIGDGHDTKVITGGRATKFAIDLDKLDDIREIVRKYGLKLVGLNQHIGSHFLSPDRYLEGSAKLLEIAKTFPGLELIDFGGGFGIPYHKFDGEARLDLQALGRELDRMMFQFAEDYGKEVLFRVEPGRYVVAESGVLLGGVHAVKTVFEDKYAGTDLGFTVLIRPTLYNAYHDLEIYRENGEDTGKKEVVHVAGNICESGDLIAKERLLPEILEGDLIGVLDAGAYGYSMASNYNLRLRPAEVLIDLDGHDRLIRSADDYADLLRGFPIEEV